MDVAYVFQHLNPNNPQTTRTDLEISEAMSTYWVNFARHGDPNGDGVPEWPAFNERDPRVMHLNRTPHPGLVPSADSLKILDAYFAWRRTPEGEALAVAAATTPDGRPSTQPKTFMDYFLPTPPQGGLSRDAWGATNVIPRDPRNGLEDTTIKQYCYWDGQIIKAPDGRYHMFASRWAESRGHNGWFGSVAVHAVSDSLMGPYIDKGLCWPNDAGGRGHNVGALTLPDGSYAVYVSETRPCEVYISKSLDGPWKHLGTITVEDNPRWHGSNVSLMVRPDGTFEFTQRDGSIFTSDKGILGPYKRQSTSVYPKGIPNLEDPCIWYSGGLYHIVVNSWSTRKAYHLTSRDGIHDWTNRGRAYDPRESIVRYPDGTVNHWNKVERPAVYIENGHVVAMTLAAIDVEKEQDKGGDGHGSKVIVIPFDGAALDRDLQSQTHSSTQTNSPATAAAPAPSIGLKDAFAGKFLIGCAGDLPRGYSEAELAHIKANYNIITPENCMKPQPTHPSETNFTFATPDALVKWCGDNNIKVWGHTLAWHAQTARWFFQGTNGEPVTRELAMERLSNHIHTVVGRYRGKVIGWDVVNEAINDGGDGQTENLRNSQWVKAIGPDFLTLAFKWAHEADPEAQLYYNDYNIEQGAVGNKGKHASSMLLLKRLIKEGAPINGVGIQGHWHLNTSIPDVEKAIQDYESLGLKVSISELDVTSTGENSGAFPTGSGGGTVSVEAFQKQAEVYAKLFDIFDRHAKTISRVTFWGISDRRSWRSRQKPLLYDTQLQPKPALQAILDVAKGK